MRDAKEQPPRLKEREKDGGHWAEKVRRVSLAAIFPACPSFNPSREAQKLSRLQGDLNGARVKVEGN